MISEQPSLGELMHKRLPYNRAEMIWICRHEFPQKLEDVLARRTRSLLLDALASKEMAPEVARIMAHELGFDEEWQKREVQEYNLLVEKYVC
jgi:glycerol-3-phosphate dehydrogenase